jgi:putative DNA primase/helicase
MSEQQSLTGEEFKKKLEDACRLDRAEYLRRRQELASELRIPVGLLDEERKKAEKGKGNGDDTPQFLADPVLWPEPVDGAELLDEIVIAAKKHLVLPKGAAEALALWVVFSHAHDSFNISPVLAATSPAPECGKTTLLTFLSATVARPLSSSNLTASIVFRAVEKWKPTLLIDEADTFLGDKDDLRGVINSGHNRGAAYVLRAVGEDYEPKRFCTWAPKAIALIGKLSPTLSSRSIHIRLRRKAQSERIIELRADRLGPLAPFGQKAARFAADNTIGLHAAEPKIPDELYGRSADNWRPLLAVADVAGGKWPELARRVAKELSGSASEEVAGIMLLEDLRAIWEKQQTHALHSQDIVKALVAMEGRPWAEWRHDKPLTKTQLAALLEPFGITPKQVWATGRNLQGYEREAFTDTFKHYLSGPRGDQNPRTLDTLETKDFEENETLERNRGLGFRNPRNPNELNGSRVLGFQQPLGGKKPEVTRLTAELESINKKRGDAA